MKSLPSPSTDGFHYLLDKKVPLLQKALGDTLDSEALERLTAGLHPSELAHLIRYLEDPYRTTFVAWLKPHFNPEIFLFLNSNVRDEIISLLSLEEIASVVSVLESDDALSLLSTLEPDDQQAVLDTISPEKRAGLTLRMQYPAYSAGRLMQQEVLALPQDWTIQKSLEYIAYASDLPVNIYDAFIVNDQRCPVGIVSLSCLIKRPKHLTLQEVMKHEVRTIPAQWDQEEVAFLFRLYDLLSAPVVNQQNELIGMITIDDVVDVIERKATEDIMYMGRVHSMDFHASTLSTSLSRLHWLVVTLLNTLLTSMVINQFQATLQNKVALTILMPIAAAMGGNAGIQTSTVSIRALATRELTMLNAVRTFFKEIRVALLNGVIFAALLSILALCWFQDLGVSLVLGGAVIFNMLWAGGAGTFLPLLISKMGYDPALSAGPLLTTTTDILGYAVFLGLAEWLL